MTRSQTTDSGMNINQLHNVAVNGVETICSVVTMPVEMMIRPQYGTRYFPVPVAFLTAMMMIALPLLSAIITAFQHAIPFSRYRPPIGLFGIGTFAECYFLLSVVHAVRLYRRMIDMSREQNSEYEGPPLPFFGVFPKSDSFWFTRIVLEPVFVLVTATILGRIFIFQSGLTLYLQIAALMLAVKQFIGWFRNWEYLRKIMDARFAGPIIARMADNRATEDDLATVHLASFPKDLSPDLRAAAVSHIARTLSPEAEATPNPSTTAQ